ncbi:MAG: putative glucokinase, partial [Verrucomicrobiota bacterium]
NGLHPEIGHWRLSEEGPTAFGRIGSAEALCSAKGLGRIATWLFPECWPAEPEPAAVSALAAQGHAMAEAVLKRHALYTARVCAMIAELLCPDLILLGSLATHIGPRWTNEVQTRFQEEVLPRIGDKVNVQPNALGKRLQDLSALVVALPTT